MKIICGYTWPTSGEVNVLGNLYGTVDLREVRKTIGWVSTALIAQLHDHETAYRIVLSGREATIGLYSVPSAEDKKKGFYAAAWGIAHIDYDWRSRSNWLPS